MLLFKPFGVKFDALVSSMKHIQNEHPHNTWGWMLRVFKQADKSFKTIMFQKNINSYEMVADMIRRLKEIEDIVFNLDRTEIAVINTPIDTQGRMNGTPMLVSSNIKSAPVQNDYRDKGGWFFVCKCFVVAMVDEFVEFDKDLDNKWVFSKEQRFVADCLASFKEQFLRENLANIVSRYNLFGDKNFIILDKRYGFTFFGNYRDAKQKIMYSDIRDCKSIVYSEKI